MQVVPSWDLEWDRVGGVCEGLKSSWVALELSPQPPRRQWRASTSERIPGRSSTGELSLTSHGYIGETEAASEKLVDLRFASVTLFTEGGRVLLGSLQEGLARWAPHCAESAPQPPGFAGVTCLPSTMLGAQHCGSTSGEASAHRLLLHIWVPQFSHLQYWAHWCLLY